MRAIFHPLQLGHDPTAYFRRGATVPHPERAERAIILRDMLVAQGCAIDEPLDHGEAAIVAVHSQSYVDFWREAHADWQAEGPDAGALAVPTYHPGPHFDPARNMLPSGFQGRFGYYATDTSVPLTPGTWDAIYWSAQSAIEAAKRAQAGERMTYALCRPPGHHALRAAANGFCFFNNASIAAQHLAAHGRVAILDVDAHAPNGTQDIFYARSDVMLASLHVDPADYPPYFLGQASETGTGDGEGTTRNIILAPGSDTPQILGALDGALTAIDTFDPAYLVVSLGFDMAGDDPLSVVDLTGDGFTEMARRIAGLARPTVLVQEGGYLGPSLARNAARFLNAARAATIGG